MLNKQSKFSVRQEKEAAFFDEIADGMLASAKDEQESLLLVDVDVALKSYADYYQYAYNQLEDITGKRILDMGCGSGKSSVILAKNVLVNAHLKRFHTATR